MLVKLPTYFYDHQHYYALLGGAPARGLLVEPGGYWYCRLNNSQLEDRCVAWQTITQTFTHFSTSVATYTVWANHELRVYTSKHRKADAHAVLKSVWQKDLANGWTWKDAYDPIPEHAHWIPHVDVSRMGWL